MNFWIQSRRADVLKLLGHVDLMTLNDAEARQLTEKANLVQAAQWIMARGPRHVIIKKASTARSCSPRSQSSSRQRFRSRTCSIPRALAMRSPEDSSAILPRPAT